ncbi:restriction endonuclease subunit S [Butyricimonas hominis]|uniref:restriction endonuclease subunit S n=1 Tax=Butyricimonas hominis TaxID=2763032 RepID=UPI001C9B7EC9|nr:restriction endonuclease subunit S [Butyricimonas hominis]
MRFPGFEGEWKRYKICDVLDFFPTNSLSWEQLEYTNGDNLFNLHYGLIHKELPIQTDLKVCNLPSIKKRFTPKSYTVCEDGDIAFADASEDTNDIGKVVEFLNCAGKKIVCGLHTIHGRDKKKMTVTGFKGYAFSSIAFRNQIKRLAQGTKIFSLSTKNFNESFISIPSKEEQAKIADLLYLIDQRITTQSKIIEDLKLLKSTLRHNIFTDLDNSNVEIKLIKDVLNYEQPTNYIISNTNYQNDPILIPVLTANKAFILGYTSDKDGIYNKGNCIIFDDFTMDLKYVDFPFKVKSSAIKILTPRPKVSLKYIFEYLSFLNLVSSNHKRHYISEVESMPISVPKLYMQNIFANLFSAVDKKIESESNYHNLLLLQKQYLLNHIFI